MLSRSDLPSLVRGQQTGAFAVYARFVVVCDSSEYSYQDITVWHHGKGSRGFKVSLCSCFSTPDMPTHFLHPTSLSTATLTKRFAICAFDMAGLREMIVLPWHIHIACLMDERIQVCQQTRFTAFWCPCSWTATEIRAVWKNKRIALRSRTS